MQDFGNLEVRPCFRLNTSIAGAALTTFGFSANGSQASVNSAGALVTMSYDYENRLRVHQQPATMTVGTSTATYLYSADNLKRAENVDGSVTTLVWDGSDYLQGRQ